MGIYNSEGWGDRVIASELLNYIGLRDLGSVLVSESVRILGYLLERYTQVQLGYTRSIDSMGVLEGSLLEAGYYTRVGASIYLLGPYGDLQGDLVWNSLCIEESRIRSMLGTSHLHFLWHYLIELVPEYDLPLYLGVSNEVGVLASSLLSGMVRRKLVESSIARRHYLLEQRRLRYGYLVSRYWSSLEFLLRRFFPEGGVFRVLLSSGRYCHVRFESSSLAYVGFEPEPIRICDPVG